MALNSDNSTNALKVPLKCAQSIRRKLQDMGLWDGTRKAQKYGSNFLVLPISKTSTSQISGFIKELPDGELLQLNLEPAARLRKISPAVRLQRVIKDLLEKHSLSSNLLEEVPSKWERHGDLVILPSSAFTSLSWNSLGAELWDSVSTALSCQRLARHSSIAPDGFRSSQVSMLRGENGVVNHKDNGIWYTYDVTKLMFSAGNVSEKLRVAQFDCQDEIVVDLYAGIGYFSLPYLVHAKAKHLHACEWNPKAADALRQNLAINGVADRCTVYEGDNRKITLVNVADRINLGLIPSSEPGWPVAARLLKLSGGMLHVHGNVTWGHIKKKEFSVTASAHASEDMSNCASTFLSSSRSSGENDNGCLSDFMKETMISEIQKDGDLVNLRSETNCSLQFKHSTVSLRQPEENIKKHSPGMLCQEDFNSPDAESGKQKFSSEAEEIEYGQECNAHDFHGISSSNGDNKNQSCVRWGEEVRKRFCELLVKEKGGLWSVVVRHIERVKSYAPHVEHVVVDLECRPETGQGKS